MNYAKSLSKITYFLILIWTIIVILSLSLDSTQINRLKSYSTHIFALWIVCVTLVYFKKTQNVRIVKNSFFWLFYIILVNIIRTGFDYKIIETVVWWPLSFYIFYLFGKNDYSGSIDALTKRNFKFFFIIVYLLYIYSSVTIIQETSGSSGGIYFLICLIPLVLTQKPGYKYTFLILIFIAAIFSVKRGAFLCISLVITYIVIVDFKSMSKIRIKLFVFILLGWIFAIFALANTKYFIIEKFSTLKEDEGSGRIEIFQDTWESYLKKTSIKQFFGSGHNSVANDNAVDKLNDPLASDRSAHNDFLEILYDYGIVGIIIYSSFIISLFSYLKKAKQLNAQIHQVLISSIIVFFLLSMYSHLNLYPQNFLYLVGIWGFYIGKLNLQAGSRNSGSLRNGQNRNSVITPSYRRAYITMN